jgi:hypothetical protein
VIERWPSGPMLVIEVFSAALYLAQPELDRAHGLGLLSKLSTWSRVNFVSVGRFIYQEFDDYSLFVFCDVVVQTSFDVM